MVLPVVESKEDPLARREETANNKLTTPVELDQPIIEGEFLGEGSNRSTASQIVRPRLLHVKVDDAFLGDPPNERTISRRLADFLMQFRWYNPRAKKNEQEDANEEEHGAESDVAPSQDNQALPDPSSPLSKVYPFTNSILHKPSLARAWAYFEHVALPRYIVTEENDRLGLDTWFQRSVNMDRAEPGASKRRTKLYSPWFTPHSQLGDWGLGIGLYFTTLRAVAILTLLAGVLNIPNLVYFASESYRGADNNGLSGLLQASAICTDTSWVPCPDCSLGDFTETRAVVAINRETNQEMILTLRNNCEIKLFNGLINYATVFFLILSMVWLKYHVKLHIRHIDEDEQTATDYSIVIPIDHTLGKSEIISNPDYWRDLIHEKMKNIHVTAVTVAVDNDHLVEALVERRNRLKKLEMLMDPGSELSMEIFENRARQVNNERTAFEQFLAKFFLPGIPEHYWKLYRLNQEVTDLVSHNYTVSSIFVTFETEFMQRRVLQAMEDEEFKVGKVVLTASEPNEPSTIRWNELNESLSSRVKQQIITFSITVGLIVAMTFITKAANEYSRTFSAYAIAIANSTFPMIAKLLTGTEKHPHESDKQGSLYFKIAIFRWINTAVVITIITPFTETLEETGLIRTIYKLFFAEIVTSTGLQLVDYMGHLNRHILAPRAPSQDAMNRNFQGTDFELAERYTNMTKILFLALWYSAIYPGALFMCSIALIINYFADRFSLMRAWKRQPQLGSTVSNLSRKYFFVLSLIAMTLMCSYYWSGFPYDNLCEAENNDVDVSGNWVFNTTSGFVQEVRLMEDSTAYRFCLQDFMHYEREERRWPFLPKHQRDGSEWMTSPQESVCNIWGYSSAFSKYSIEYF